MEKAKNQISILPLQNPSGHNTSRVKLTCAPLEPPRLKPPSKLKEKKVFYLSLSHSYPPGASNFFIGVTDCLRCGMVLVSVNLITSRTSLTGLPLSTGGATTARLSQSIGRGESRPSERC
jgi:hypothetical protein